MINPCLFKEVCLQCKKVSEGDRPTVCISIKCKDYKPCPRCENNRKLFPFLNTEICRKCIEKDKTFVNKALPEAKKMVRQEIKQSTGEINKLKEAAKVVRPTENQIEQATIDELMAKASSMIPVETFGEMSQPGTPPTALNESEKTYYNTRWEEYKEYYRNPSSFFMCHQIILMEIYVNHINTRLITARGELQIQTLNEQSMAAKVMTDLKKMLPDAESEEVSDHEKALGMIYEAYVREKKKTYVGGVSRLLSPEAIALNPLLHFPVNLREIYTRLGYTTEDADKVLGTMAENEDMKNSTPEEIAEFFGFRPRKQFATADSDENTTAYIDENDFGDDELNDVEEE